jgi:hypothetical protein
MKAYRIVGCYGYHIVYTIGSEIMVKLSALSTGRHISSQKCYISASDTGFCYRLSKLQGLLLSEGLGKLIKIIRLIGFEPATFRLVS